MSSDSGRGAFSEFELEAIAPGRASKARRRLSGTDEAEQRLAETFRELSRVPTIQCSAGDDPDAAVPHDELLALYLDGAIAALSRKSRAYVGNDANADALQVGSEIVEIEFRGIDNLERTVLVPRDMHAIGAANVRVVASSFGRSFFRSTVRFALNVCIRKRVTGFCWRSIFQPSAAGRLRTMKCALAASAPITAALGIFYRAALCGLHWPRRRSSRSAVYATPKRSVRGLNAVLALVDAGVLRPAKTPKTRRLVVESMDKLSIARIDSSWIWGYTLARFC